MAERPDSTPPSAADADWPLWTAFVAGGLLLGLLILLAGSVYASTKSPLQGDPECLVDPRIPTFSKDCHRVCWTGALWFKWGRADYCTWAPKATGGA